MEHKKSFLVSIGFALCASAAYADDDIKPYSTENEWNSAQISAAGGIGSASDNVVDQFFSDPSVLAQNKRKFVLQFAGIHTYMSRDLVDTVSDVTTFASESSADASTDENSKMVDALNKFKKVFGRRVIGGVNLNFFSLKINGLSIVPYVSGSVRAIPRVAAWPRATALTDVYAGFGIGYAFSLNPKWDLGANIRPGYRNYFTARADASSIGSDLNPEGSTTSGTSSAASYTTGSGLYLPVDVAGGFNLNKEWRFSLVIRDLGGAPAFSSTDEKPPVYPMRINLGTNWNFYDKGVHKVQFLTEIQDLANIVNHEGALLYRWQWAGIYKFRIPSRQDTSFGFVTGLQSGYPSVGVLVDLFIVKLEGTLYEVEGAAYTGQAAERRYSVKAYSQLAF